MAYVKNVPHYVFFIVKYTHVDIKIVWTKFKKPFKKTSLNMGIARKGGGVG